MKKIIGQTGNSLQRRDFLKQSAAATLGLVLTRLPAMAGPFTRVELPQSWQESVI